MGFHNGWVFNTIEQYELKQQEQSDLINEGIRYAGRVIDGITTPDVTLSNGMYFLPSLNREGDVEIEYTDIEQQD
tara:strand:- start:11746 stop:11970 length:225 start_codon:yes stop_codon:yes gene_type:complete